MADITLPLTGASAPCVVGRISPAPRSEGHQVTVSIKQVRVILPTPRQPPRAIQVLT